MAGPTAGTTVVATSSPQAIKLYSVSLSAEIEKESVWLPMMSEKAPTFSMAVAKRERQQSRPQMPLVIITDLEKAAGDRVTCDLIHMVTGEPVMGDRVIEGRGQPMTFADMEVRIDQMRFPIDAGSRMSQKRTSHNLRRLTRANMVSWFARTNDQIIQTHLAGARGSEQTEDWNVPLESHPRFNEIMVNPVEPPTSNRYFVAGGGSTVEDLSTTSVLSLNDLDMISTVLKDMTFPPAPIQSSRDMESQQEPIWCLMLTHRQWHYLQITTGENSWRSYLTNASIRGRPTGGHPLFAGRTGLWNGLLLKRMPRATRFQAGDTVRRTNSDDGTTLSNTVPNGITVDRAILLGGQALAIARGDAGGSSGGYPMKWTEVLRDHGNSVEVGGGQMDGKKKFRFIGTDNKHTDLGVCVIDSYAPDPMSSAGRALVSSLQS